MYHIQFPPTSWSNSFHWALIKHLCYLYGASVRRTVPSECWTNGKNGCRMHLFEVDGVAKWSVVSHSVGYKFIPTQIKNQFKKQSYTDHNCHQEYLKSGKKGLVVQRKIRIISIIWCYTRGVFDLYICSNRRFHSSNGIIVGI